MHLDIPISSASTEISGDFSSVFSAEESQTGTNDSSTDSTYDSDSLLSDTTSVSASAIQYLHVHNHRYDAELRSLMPNDESEQDRLDVQHHIFKMVLDGALTAGALPTSPQHILDVGTGTGIRAIEMGDCYPSAIVTGVDISPIQPTWVPANVNFELDDVTKPWVWPQTSMDFIHIRNLVGSIRDYPALFAEAFRTLKPGGVIEVSEIRARFDCQDGSFAARGRACRRWEDALHAIAKEGGWDFDPTTKAPGWLKEVGFADVRARSRLVPVGAWPKESRLKDIGRWHLSHMLHGGMENYSMMLFTRAGWDPAAVRALLREVEREVQDPMMHSFTKACFITAMKPPLP